MRILLVEDEPDISDLIAYHLRDLKFVVDVVAEGEEALEVAQQHEYRLMIIDLILPGLDGLNTCRILRQRQVMSPVLILTARAEAEEEALGLQVRADDFMRKPFGLVELISRSAALMGHAEPLGLPEQIDQPILRFGSVTLDTSLREVTQPNKQLLLTPREYDLLVFFARHSGQVFAVDVLLRRIWGYEHASAEAIVAAHMLRINELVKCDSLQVQCIERVQGGGFRFVPVAKAAGGIVT